MSGRERLGLPRRIRSIRPIGPIRVPFIEPSPASARIRGGRLALAPTALGLAFADKVDDCAKASAVLFRSVHEGLVSGQDEVRGVLGGQTGRHLVKAAGFRGGPIADFEPVEEAQLAQLGGDPFARLMEKNLIGELVKQT